MAEKQIAVEVTEDQPMSDSDRDQLKVFISHKHENKAYADVIRTELLDWGFLNESVHQSSASEASGPPIGKDLNQSIRGFLHACNLLIFIFTKKEFNWEWCSYEIGVADDPKVKNNIAVFQIFNDVPKLHGNRRIVQFDEQDVQKFVREFHKRTDFFPGYGAFSQNLEDTVLQRRASRLFEALSQVKEVDPYSVQTIPKREIRYGYFRLKIDGDVINPLFEKWNDPAGTKVTLEEVRTTLRANLKIIGSEGWGLFHFGVSEGQRDKPVLEEWTVERLEKQWKQSLKKEPTDTWVNEVVDDIWGFRNSDAPKLSWKPHESAFSKELFYPVVMYTDMHADGSRNYDVYTILIPGLKSSVEN